MIAHAYAAALVLATAFVLHQLAQTIRSLRRELAAMPTRAFRLGFAGGLFLLYAALGATVAGAWAFRASPGRALTLSSLLP